MNSFRAALITTVTVLGIACSAAMAGTSEPPVLTVKYGDLNVDSDQGASELYSRLRMASRNVCSNYERRGLLKHPGWKKCYEKALTAAVANLNVERLTALHQRTRTVRAS